MTSRSAPLDLYADAECAIFIADDAAAVVWANKRAAALTGYTMEDLQQRRLEDLLSPFHRPESSSRGPSDRDQAGPMRFRSMLLCRGGGQIDVEVLARQVKWPRQSAAILVRARDIRRECDLRKRLRSEVRRAALVQERERKRIARVVHDDILSGLLEVSLMLSEIQRGRVQTASARSEMISHVQQRFDSLIQSVRLLSGRLREEKAEDVDLVTALTTVAQGQSGDVPFIELSVVGTPLKLSNEANYLCLGAVQEALRNVERHSHATLVTIVLTFAADCVCLEVSDNGVGFDAPTNEQTAAARGALGLLGLYERAALLSGTLTITSSHNAGTCISLRVPLSTVVDLME